mgnify:CR=1 FL=1
MTTKIIEDLINAGAPEPPGLVEREIVHPGDATLPPIVVSSIQSAGHSYIYDTMTGDRSLTNNNMLATQLKKTRADGSRVFTTAKPDIAVSVGTVKCLLHAASPDRAAHDAFGWATCEADHFRSEFHLERHMAGKHKSEWAAIKDGRDKAEKAEDRAFYRAIIADRRPRGKE